MRIFNLVITTKKEYDYKISESFVDGFSACRKIEEDFEKVRNKVTWSAINPVVHSLKELRNNTWDIDRVDHAINWLKDNFEVKNDS